MSSSTFPIVRPVVTYRLPARVRRAPSLGFAVLSDVGRRGAVVEWRLGAWERMLRAIRGRLSECLRRRHAVLWRARGERVGRPAHREFARRVCGDCSCRMSSSNLSIVHTVATYKFPARVLRVVHLGLVVLRDFAHLGTFVEWRPGA